MKRGLIWATAALVLVNLAVLVVFLVRPSGSRSSSATNETAAAHAGQPGVYAVTGVVRELRADGSNVLIRHEAIPGFMMAMTMPFTARDPREVASLKAGDQVTFRLLVTDRESWIDSVERVGTSDPEPDRMSQQTRIVRDVEPLEIGDPIPDYPFTNQWGAPFRLSELRGRVVGLTFIFTRCPLPDFCPRMVNNFVEVAARLAQPGTSPTNWHLVTMTIDPAFDTPEVLRKYAERQKYDSTRWTYLTGALIDIDAITEQLGVVFRRQTPDALPDHNLRTVVIDAEGRVRRIIIGNTWSPDEMVKDMADALLEFKPSEDGDPGR